MKTLKAPKAVQLPSGSWRCRVQISGETISLVGPDKNELEKKAMALKLGVSKDKKEKASPITLRKAIDQYIEARQNILSPATIRGYRIVQNNRCPDLMDKRLKDITRQMVQKSIDAQAAQYSHKTLKNTIGLLASVFQDNDVEMNWSKVALPQAKRTEKEIYTEEQQRDFMLAARGTNVEIPVLLAMWLGMRRSEILGLRWEDINLKENKIHICRALVPDEHHRLVEKGTKTTNSTRTVKCPAYIANLLAAMPRDTQRVVPITPRALDQRLKKLAEANGLPFYGLHAMRHTNASVMLTLMPDKYAMERGGWSNEKTLKQIYQHTFDPEKKAADEAVDSYFNELVGYQKKPTRKYKLSRGHL